MGWPPDATRFFAELAEDNSRAFFDANRWRYTEHVRAPLERFLDSAFDEFGDAKVFRPNRDVRFSRDKSPYKLACYAVCGDGYYVGISASGLTAGGGLYEPSRDRLARYRAAVDGERTGRELEGIVGELAAAGHPVRGATLRRGPRGSAPDHPRAHLLRHTSLYVLEEWEPGAWLATDEADARALDLWREVRPLVEWCARHIHAGG